MKHKMTFVGDHEKFFFISLDGIQLGKGFEKLEQAVNSKNLHWFQTEGRFFNLIKKNGEEINRGFMLQHIRPKQTYVPLYTGSKKYRKLGSCYRSMRTTQERRAQKYWKFDLDLIDQYREDDILNCIGPFKISGRKRKLRTNWDDVSRNCAQKCWKNYRATQYRPVFGASF